MGFVITEEGSYRENESVSAIQALATLKYGDVTMTYGTSTIRTHTCEREKQKIAAIEIILHYRRLHIETKVHVTLTEVR